MNVNLLEFLFGDYLRYKYIKKNTNCLLLVFTDNNRDIFRSALRYIDSYLTEINIKRVIVFTDNKSVKDMAKKYIKSENRIILLSNNKMKWLCYNLSFHNDLLGLSTIKNLFLITDKYSFGNGFETLTKSSVLPSDYLIWNRIFHARERYIGEIPSIK